MLTRAQKTFFKITSYVALAGLLFGLWTWLSFFRIVHIRSEDNTRRYSLILLKTPKINDEVVFTYPNLNSPMRISKLSKNKSSQRTVLIEGEKKPLNEDLVVGVLIY